MKHNPHIIDTLQEHVSYQNLVLFTACEEIEKRDRTISTLEEQYGVLSDAYDNQKKKVTDVLVERLCWLGAEITHSKDLATLEYFMGGHVWLLAFGRDAGLLSLEDYNDWSSRTNFKWQQRKNFLQERNNND